MRVCTCCGKLVFAGYTVTSGNEYYCSSECLGKYYSSDEWNEMYGDESYYSEWKPNEDDPVDYIEVIPEEMLRIFSYAQILLAIKKALGSVATTSISKKSFIILAGQKLSE